MIQNPKDFFQQVQNLVEEVALKIKAISSSLSSYLTKADAEATYLDKTEAANTYLGKDEKASSATVADSATSANRATNDANGNNISNTYLKTTTASSTYLTQTDAQSKYLGKTAKAASATTADTATSATSAGTATKAIQDGDGNVISGTYLKSATAKSTYLSKTDASSTYLGKTAKAESANTADTATSATSASTATKAIQDGDGNVISGTYLKSATAQSTYLSKTDASSTYLGKTSKAESAKTADSATKATQDGSGNVIEQTYLKTAPVTSVNGQTGDVSINVTAPVTSVNGMTGAVTIDRVNNAGWADGAWSATVTPSVQAAVKNGNRACAPAGGTWWCVGAYTTVNQSSENSSISHVSASFAGGAIIADPYDSLEDVKIACIRIA